MEAAVTHVVCSPPEQEGEQTKGTEQLQGLNNQAREPVQERHSHRWMDTARVRWA
jgi:hypothetical protein